VALPAASGGPAVLVKIDDTPAGRSGHRGVADAELVVEEPVEAGMGRLAVLQTVDHPSRVGPVRSLRPPDLHLSQILGGITLAYSGAQPGIDALVHTGPARLVAERERGVWHRDGSRLAPHNLYVDTRALAQDAAPARPLLWPAASPTSGGVLATRITVPVGRAAHTTRWSWDAGASRWVRSTRDGRPIRDTDGSRQGAKTLVVLTVATRGTPFRDLNRDTVPDVALPGSGDGWVLTGPRAYRVRWSEAAAGQPIRLTTPTGTAIGVTGQTWVSLAPTATRPG
jgi:hypothetical protein